MDNHFSQVVKEAWGKEKRENPKIELHYHDWQEMMLPSSPPSFIFREIMDLDGDYC
jgi:hypothetical protein